MQLTQTLYSLWERLYPDSSTEILEQFLSDHSPAVGIEPESHANPTWYKDAVVYSLYIDLFNKNIPGLIDKLDYLQDLGVSCLWLLPILESPMRDAGFDISDYYSVRKNLRRDSDTGLEDFRMLLKESHARSIRIIFDVAMNHTSDQHHWFQEALTSSESPYRDFFIWTDNPNQYNQARIIFKGIENSNWEKSGDQWYFHRFFNFQPDLNYRNPKVLLAMCEVLLFWQKEGVDGFRADAVPYIWKQEGTDCENLDNTHIVVKFFRAVLDYCKPGTLLLAEACQPPTKVVEYLGQGDECHAAYHFPLMPRIFISMAQQSGDAIKETLSPGFTPSIPDNTQWFTFLRCHDELSLELVYVTEKERAFIHKTYCHQPLWDFRMGEGISARLSELLLKSPEKILSAYSLMLTLPGTPVIYYGDETAKLNDLEYYNEMVRQVGKDDTRFLVRGFIDWHEQNKQLQDPDSLSYKVFYPLKKMINTRNHHPCFGRGSIEFFHLGPDDLPGIFTFKRQYRDEEIMVIHNLSDGDISIELPGDYKHSIGLLAGNPEKAIKAHSFHWLLKTRSK